MTHVEDVTAARTFAIGDIHGCARTFRALLTEQLKVKKGDTLYCLGDLIDRGPDSKGVIDTVLELRQNGIACIALRGNHEALFLDIIDGKIEPKNWFVNGGEAMLKSFGVSAAAGVPESYIRFIRDTCLYVAQPGFILVHAGLNFSLPDPFLDTRTMLWDRNFDYHAFKAGNRILVHGHTPRSLDYILAQKTEGSVNIDSGCVYMGQYGHLTALDLNTLQFHVQPAIEDIKGPLS
jgi:serine/threonine protein phosphatase 1